MTAAPAQGSSTIKLKTNIPLIGVVQYADYAKTKNPEYSDQIKLKGNFDGHGEASVYLPLPVASALIKDNLARGNGTDRDGNPAYQWLHKGKVQILKSEDGQKKFTTVTPLEKNGSPPIQQGDAHEGEHDDNVGDGTVPPPDKLARKRWADLYETYKACVDMARKAWPQDTPPDVLHAAAATLLIAADKRNLPTPPKRAKS